MVDYNPFDEDKAKTEEQAAPQVSGGPSTVAPTASTISGTGTGGQSQQRGSGRFTNIQKYLKANQGNTIGQDLGNKVEEEAKSPLANIGSARDQLQKNLQSEQGRLGGAGNLFGRISSYAKGGNSLLSEEQYNEHPSDKRYWPGGQFADDAPGTMHQQDFRPGTYQEYLKAFGSQQPEQLADTDFEEFGKLRTGASTVPTIDNMGDLEAGAGKIQGLSDAAGTEQGRFGLLNQFFGKPTYNTGQQRLDQLLLQTQPGAANQFSKQASGINKDTQAQLSALKGMHSTGINDLATQAAAKQKEAQDLIGGAVVGEEQGTGLFGGLVDTLEGRAKSATDQQAKEQQVLTDLFSGKRGTGEQAGQDAMAMLKRLGINAEDKFYMPEGVSAQSFIGPAQQASISNVTSPEERAKYLALQRLSGQEVPNFLTGQEELKGFDPNSYFNREQFAAAQSKGNADIGSKFIPYEKEVAGLSPAIQLQKDLEARMDPVKAMGKAVAAGLDPNVMSELISGSKEFQNRQSSEFGDMLLPNTLLTAIAGQGSGGMQAGYTSLAERLNAQAFLPSYLNKINSAQTQLANLKNQYGGGSISDLIARYSGLPTQMQDIPTATGPGGKMGIF